MFVLDDTMILYLGCLGAWAIGFPAYLIGKKMLGHKYPSKFTTTEFKRKFKKHDMAFSNEFKNNNTKLFTK